MGIALIVLILALVFEHPKHSRSSIFTKHPKPRKRHSIFSKGGH
jgi:hypothetical protein